MFQFRVSVRYETLVSFEFGWMNWTESLGFGCLDLLIDRSLQGPYRTYSTYPCLLGPSSIIMSFSDGLVFWFGKNKSSQSQSFFSPPLLFLIGNFKLPAPTARDFNLSSTQQDKSGQDKKARFKYILLYCTRKIVSTPVSTLSLSRVESVSQSALHYYLQSALSSQRLRLIIVGLIVSIKYCNTVYLGIILCSKWNTHRQQFPFSFGWCKPTLW